jgi:hypothetical protein
MYMLTHRLQILLDERQYQRLARHAEEQRTSVAAVIRSAIDQAMGGDLQARRREALEALLAAEPMPVPDDWADLRRELDDAHAAKFE